MKEGTLMRVLFCKIHCPLICFCKPSAAHLYPSGPLKLETRPNVVPSTALADSSVSDKSSSVVNGKDEEAENALKSCIKKLPHQPKEVGKKRVQWMDNLGKQLAEIKEFESRGHGQCRGKQPLSLCHSMMLLYQLLRQLPQRAATLIRKINEDKGYHMASLLLQARYLERIRSLDSTIDLSPILMNGMIDDNRQGSTQS